MRPLTWSDIENKYLEADKNLKEFFSLLSEGKILSPSGVTLTYRDSQELFSLLVMKAIKNKEVLLIEAGVGTGKSFGYLIPIFHTMKEVTTFDKILISTSSIGLQEQLLGDIKAISELLNLPIKVEISKGMNNYACLRNICIAIESSLKHKKSDDLKLLKSIKNQVKTNGIIDKALFPFNPSAVWDMVQVSGGCDKCEYKSTCEFVSKEQRIKDANIVIANHTQLANMIKMSNPSLVDSKMVVIDEAHKLEEELRLSTESKFDIISIWRRIQSVMYSLESLDNQDFYYEIKSLNEMLKVDKDNNPAIELLRALRNNGKYLFDKENIGSAGLKEVDKISINLNNSATVKAINALLEKYRPFMKIARTLPDIPSIKKEVEFIKESICLLEDMSKGTASENVYWIKYKSESSNDIEILYSKKNIKDKLESLYSQDRPVVLTSATLETNGNYDKILSDLSLCETNRLETEDSISSPFDYDNNTLFYYDTNMSSPLTKEVIKSIGRDNKDSYRANYILNLALKIRDLILITGGKALVLFTSKTDMVEVYNIVRALLPDKALLLQSDKNVSKWKSEFENAIDSTLFATGAFWEGIDLKGKTLSNVIIARLPFPVQDPIMDYKMSINPSKNSEVLINEMLIKLKQGTGRLIRTTTDTGIVCCLDPRVKDYLDEIKRTLPFTKYTTDIEEIIRFSEEKIAGSEKPKVFKIMQN